MVCRGAKSVSTSQPFVVYASSLCVASCIGALSVAMEAIYLAVACGSPKNALVPLVVVTTVLIPVRESFSQSMLETFINNDTLFMYV